MESIHKKSQSATEFIMNYGWAFLIVLIVIFSLIYFGILDPYQFLPEKAELGEGVDIVDASVDENSISFILRNTMGRDIYDFQINATGCNDGNGTLSTAVDIPEGKTKKITIYCEHDYAVGSKIDSGLEALWKTRTSTKGERYDFDQKTTGIVKVTVNKGKELYDREGISACGTLNLTKTIYILQDNISTTGTCLNISVDDVEIDGNGLSITGGGESTNYGILNYGNRRNITIKNFGNIINFSKGIYLDNVNDSSVQNNTIDFNCSQDTYGFYLGSMSSNQIINNTIDLYCPDDYSLAGLLVNYQYFNNNTINDNSIELYTLAVDSSAFGMRFLGTSDFGYNVIQNNLINISYSDNSGYGIQGAGGSNCTISDNAIWIRAFSVAEGIKFTGANNFTFHNLTLNIHKTTDALWGTGLYLSNVWSSNISLLDINITTPSVPLRVADIRVSGSNNNFSNSLLKGIGYPIYSYSGSVNNTFLNVTYNSTNEFMPAGALLTRKWYYKAYVNDTEGSAVSGASLQVLNTSGHLVTTLTTGSDGWTEKGEITEYVNTGGTTSYYSNYTINASDAAYVGQHSNYNVSVEENKLDDTITVSVVDPYVAFALGTPYDGSSQAESDIYVNVTAGTSNGNASTFIDFNNSLVSWWRMDDLELGDELVTNGDFSDGLTGWEGYTSEWTNEFDEDAKWVGIGGDETLNQSVSTTGGNTYRVQFTVTPVGIVDDQMIVKFGTTTLATVTNFEVVYSDEIIASGDNINIELDPNEVNREGHFYIDDVSVKEVDTVQDYMNRNNGIVINATQTDSGRMGKGFDFDGDGDYIVAGDDDTLDFDNSSEYTWALWVKYQGFPNEQQCFLSKDPPPPPVPKGSGFNLCFNNSPGGGDIVVCNYNSEWDCSTGLGLNLSADTWHHIAIIYDGNSGWQIHNNGQDMGEITKEINSDSAADYFIGAGTLDGFPPQLPKYYFNGTIDDVMIFNRSLSADEVAGLYASSSSKYLGNNFTGLGSGDHTFKAYVQDTSGNVNSTEERTVTIS